MMVGDLSAQHLAADRLAGSFFEPSLEEATRGRSRRDVVSYFAGTGERPL
jgi:hypothetical protein